MQISNEHIQRCIDHHFSVDPVVSLIVEMDCRPWSKSVWEDAASRADGAIDEMFWTSVECSFEKGPQPDVVRTVEGSVDDVVFSDEPGLEGKAGSEEVR